MKTVMVRAQILKANQEAARENRETFRRLGLVVINLMGSPGAGKTSLLERLASEGTWALAALEGDPQTTLDAQRLEARGVPVVQIVTQGTCHLSAGMVHRALKELDLRGLRFLFIENVGNLVCPASFDLGETARVVVFSTPEGEDKPLKYPGIFSSAHAVVVNKIDLLPHVPFSMDRAHDALRQVAPKARVFPLSCKTGEGVSDLVSWLGRLAPH